VDLLGEHLAERPPKIVKSCENKTPCGFDRAHPVTTPSVRDGSTDAVPCAVARQHVELDERAGLGAVDALAGGERLVVLALNRRFRPACSALPSASRAAEALGDRVAPGVGRGNRVVSHRAGETRREGAAEPVTRQLDQRRARSSVPKGDCRAAFPAGALVDHGGRKLPHAASAFAQSSTR
jgi:hypothetical protein